jgi:hypothetical protein
VIWRARTAAQYARASGFIGVGSISGIDFSFLVEGRLRPLVFCDPVIPRQITFDPLKGFFSGGKRVERRRLNTMSKSLNIRFAVGNGALQLIDSQIPFRD